MGKKKKEKKKSLIWTLNQVTPQQAAKFNLFSFQGDNNQNAPLNIRKLHSTQAQDNLQPQEMAMQNRKQTIYQYISRTLGSLCTLNFQRHFLHILSITECIFFLFPEKAFSLFCLRKAHKPFRNQKYLKCLFLSPNQGIERNSHILTELGEYIFCLCPLSLSNKECKKKTKKEFPSIIRERKKQTFFSRDMHIKHLQQVSLGTSVQKALFYQHRS